MKLLVAVDQSSASKKSVNSAIDLASKIEDDVTLELVHCISPVITINGDTYDESLEQAEEDGQDALDSALTEIKNSPVEIATVNTKLLHSDQDIVETLSNYINESDFDMVFMGHRNHSNKTERFVGSTTKKLISRSDVPVVAV